MSKEEKILIIEMVRDGRITSEEGVELLNALERSAAPIETPVRSSHDALHESEDEEGSLEEKAEQIGEMIEKRAEDFAQSMANMFSGGTFQRPKFMFSDELSGQFSEQGEVEVTLCSLDGAIEVGTWEKPEYHLEVVKKVNAKTEEEAKKILEGCLDFRQDGLSLAATTKPGSEFRSRSVTVDFILTLPADRKARLDLHSGDGSIVVQGVSGSSCKAATGDGSLKLEDCSFDALEVGTGDGSIAMEGLLVGRCIAKTGDGSIKLLNSRAGIADVKTGDGSIALGGTLGNVTAETMDGSITAELTGIGDWVLKTKDGPIAVKIHKHEHDSYEVDLFSGDGRVHVEGMEEANVSLDERKTSCGVRRYKARSRGFEEADSRGHLEASTGSGSVSVGFVRE